MFKCVSVLNNWKYFLTMDSIISFVSTHFYLQLVNINANELCEIRKNDFGIYSIIILNDTNRWSFPVGSVALHTNPTRRLVPTLLNVKL
jgi:hypothetical protein